MNTFECQISKNSKKISYPSPVVIDFLFKSSTPPILAYTNEIKSGELIILNIDNNKIKSIFRCNKNKLIQIYGEPVNPIKITVDCVGLNKKIKIENYITKIFENLSVNEIITFKNDLDNLEYDLMRYFLLCKNEQKIDLKKIRSICFKNCKNVNLSEKLYNMIKKDKFNYFDISPAKIKIDFLELTICLKKEPGFLNPEVRQTC